MDSAFQTALFFFSGVVALCASPSTAPQAEGALGGAGFGLADALAVVPSSSAASAVLLSLLCEGPLVDALGEGEGLVAREGKLSSSRLGGAWQVKQELMSTKIKL